MYYLENTNKTELLQFKIYKMQRRTFFKTSASTFRKMYVSKNVLITRPTNTLKKPYATHHVHTPQPETNTVEGIANNPEIILHRKTGDIVVHHPEVVEQLCVKNIAKK